MREYNQNLFDKKKKDGVKSGLNTLGSCRNPKMRWTWFGLGLSFAVCNIM